MKTACSSRQWALLVMVTMSTHVTHGHAQATTQNTSTDTVLEQLQKQLEEQARDIQSLRKSVAEQEERQRSLDASSAKKSARASKSRDDAQRLVSVGPATAVEPEQTAPAIAPLFEQPGILTPLDQFVLEPSLQYVYSSSNRISLIGYTIIPALLIGLVDVREIRRNTVTAALTARYGLTNRLEVEVRVPYVYRADSTISREYGGGANTDNAMTNKGQDLGDIELAARYQLNHGSSTFPYLISSLRLKTTSGKDPFQVVTNCTSRCVDITSGTGLPQSLPTGSGFFSLQPGLTWLFPSDPAVFFGGISYTYNAARTNIHRQVLFGEQEYLGTIKPGGVIGLNFGMGMSLNERASFSMGVDLNSIGHTVQNGEPVTGSVRTQLASLLLGYSYRYSDKTNLSVAVGAGLTRDTPDLSISIRIPKSF